MKLRREAMSSKHGRIDGPKNEGVREMRKKYRHLFVVALLGLLCNPLFADEKPQYDVAAFYWPSLHHDARWAEFFPGGGADGSATDFSQLGSATRGKTSLWTLLTCCNHLWCRRRPGDITTRAAALRSSGPAGVSGAAPERSGREGPITNEPMLGMHGE